MGEQQAATQLLGTLPFGSLIGGPMIAAVEAQAEAAMSSVQFIKSVGFTEDGKTVRTVVFNYKKNTGEQASLEVPLLTVRKTVSEPLVLSVTLLLSVFCLAAEWPATWV